MFRPVSIVCVVAMLVVVAMARFIRRRASAGESPRASRFHTLETLVFAATMLAAILLALSGFAASLVFCRPMAGRLLMAHVVVGGAFAVALPVFAMMWGEACRFSPRESGVAGWFTTDRKFLFWCFVVFGLTTTLTMLASMTPLFGTHGLEVLYDAHRWSALALVLVVMAFGIRK